MKKMKIEKQLIFADQIKRIISLQVQENLTYQQEDDGIKAMGPLFIQGEYEGAQGVQRFQETLEMDVLAPNNKLSDQPFSLKVKESEGEIKDNTIVIHITMDIFGLREDEPKQMTKDINAEQPRVETQTRPQPTCVPAQPIKGEDMERDKEDSPSEDVSKPIQSEDLNDLFADAESTFTSYRLVVAKPNDTYTGIANRYDVDESALRECNKNKEILPKTLVLLPFEKK